MDFRFDTINSFFIHTKFLLTILYERLKEFEPKYNYQIVDDSEIMNLKNFFEKGSIAMVKVGDRYSSSTEFFF